MLPFKDAFNNDNPVSDELDLESLNVWYYMILLIGSNLFGIPLTIYGHKHAFFFLAIGTFIAVFLSILYHTCQTTHVCFGFSLTTLTQLDHISAPAFMMMLILFIINLRSTKQIRNDIKLRAKRIGLLIQDPLVYIPPRPSSQQENVSSLQQSYNKPNNIQECNPYNTMNINKPISLPLRTHPNINRLLQSDRDIKIQFGRNNNNNRIPITQSLNGLSSWKDSAYECETDLSEDDLEIIESRRTYYNVGYGMEEGNDSNNGWAIYIAITSIYIVIIAAIAHPFSFQAFIIAISFGFAAIFHKIVIIDEGIPIGFYGRISLPDLLVGVFLIAISLIFYMIDIWYYYGITHSLWHIFSFMGSYFFVIGLSKNAPRWYSPIDYVYKKTLICCLKEQQQCH